MRERLDPEREFTNFFVWWCVFRFSLGLGEVLREDFENQLRDAAKIPAEPRRTSSSYILWQKNKAFKARRSSRLLAHTFITLHCIPLIISALLIVSDFATLSNAHIYTVYYIYTSAKRAKTKQYIYTRYSLANAHLNHKVPSLSAESRCINQQRNPKKKKRTHNMRRANNSASAHLHTAIQTSRLYTAPPPTDAENFARHLCSILASDQA